MRGGTGAFSFKITFSYASGAPVVIEANLSGNEHPFITPLAQGCEYMRIARDKLKIGRA